MELTENQIDFIYQDLRQRGMRLDELTESLLDHICCAIEQDHDSSFENAYQRALAAFGSDGLERTQRETIQIINHKREIIMKKFMYVLGYIALCTSTFGIMFKTMHWPGANMLIFTGILLLNFGFLPMYFYGRYKQAANS